MERANALIFDDMIPGMELSATVVLTIEDCASAMKAVFSSARTRAVTLNSVLVVQLTEYLSSAEHIRTILIHQTIFLEPE